MNTNSTVIRRLLVAVGALLAMLTALMPSAQANTFEDPPQPDGSATLTEPELEALHDGLVDLRSSLHADAVRWLSLFDSDLVPVADAIEDLESDIDALLLTIAGPMPPDQFRLALAQLQAGVQSWHEVAAELNPYWQDTVAEWEEAWTDATTEWEEAWTDSTTEWEEAWTDATTEWEEAWTDSTTEWEHAWTDATDQWEEAWTDATDQWENEWDQAADQIENEWTDAAAEWEQAWTDAADQWAIEWANALERHGRPRD